MLQPDSHNVSLFFASLSAHNYRYFRCSAYQSWTLGYQRNSPCVLPNPRTLSLFFCLSELDAVVSAKLPLRSLEFSCRYITSLTCLRSLPSLTSLSLSCQLANALPCLHDLCSSLSFLPSLSSLKIEIWSPSLTERSYTELNACFTQISLSSVSDLSIQWGAHDSKIQRGMLTDDTISLLGESKRLRKLDLNNLSGHVITGEKCGFPLSLSLSIYLFLS